MKKGFINVLILGLALILNVNTSANTCSGIEITANYLNVRTGPGTNYTRVGRVIKGQQYVVIGEYGNWRKIWINSKARWVYSRNYTIPIVVEYGEVKNTSTLNVRSGPSTAYRKVGTAPRGSKWVITGQNGSWRKVWYNGNLRWMHGYYLEELSTAPSIEVLNFQINNGDIETESRFVTVNCEISGSATYYQISEKSNFADTSWKSFTTSNISFTLSENNEEKTVYFRVKNSGGRISNTFSDTILLNVPAPKFHTIDRYKFYAEFRNQFGPLKQSQVDGINYLLDNFEIDNNPAINNLTVWQRQIAYLFATVKHEVANTYMPITEYSNRFCVNYDGGCTYKGRGYVQLTHKYNYETMSQITGYDLVSNPELALDPDIAYTVMSYGSFYGTFTGYQLGSYIKSSKTDYYNARRVINGLDKASLIKGYAQKFQIILEKSAK